jgi:hypothetical protein
VAGVVAIVAAAVAIGTVVTISQQHPVDVLDGEFPGPLADSTIGGRSSAIVALRR